MPVITPSSVSILPANQQSGGSLKNAAQGMNNAQSDDAALWSTAGGAFVLAQSQIDHICNALRKPVPLPDPIQITDPSGNLIAEIGSLTGTNNQAYPGIWGRNLYVGGTGPDTAPFFANGQDVVIGQNGQVFVLDPYGDVGAWLGTESEAPKNISGAANNGVGLIRITLTAHGYVSGDNVHMDSVGGVPKANGSWVIKVFDADNFDLVGSSFAGTYTGGGTATRFYSGGAFSSIAVGASQLITNVVNNGAGLARVTVPAHGYATGYSVVITSVVGVTGINTESWLITVIDTDNFDLIGSVFAGAYVSGGLSINWPTAKLVARDDGSLTINGAEITLNSNGITTTINNQPTGTTGWPSQNASLISADNASGAFTEIDPFHIAVVSATGIPIVYMENDSGTGTLIVATALNTSISTLTPGTIVLNHNGGTAHFNNQVDFDGMVVSKTGSADVVTVAFNEITVLAGASGVTIGVSNVDSPGFSAGGVPGINFTSAFGTSLTLGTGSFGVSLSVGTGTAVTSVTGVGVTSTTGTFVTGVSLNVGTALTSAVLNTAPNTWTKGLLTN